jgi:hypothetical protein
MRIQEKIQGKIAVLSISGNMMGGKETCGLNEKVKSLIADGIKSPGLGILIGCWSTLARENGSMKVANATAKVNNLLVLTHLLEFFGNYESVQRAVASYSQSDLIHH